MRVKRVVEGREMSTRSLISYDNLLRLFSIYTRLQPYKMSEAPVASSSTAPAATAGKPARSARGRPADDPDTRHSKTLSYILRHGAAKESLTLRPDGFVRVEDLVSRLRL